MSQITINEWEDQLITSGYCLDLTQKRIKDCTGCWSCWWKTPGRCIYTDLDDFYYEYIHADRVIILSTVKRGFVSGQMKTLFDRMIPLFLPYVAYTHESMHMPRYASYPAIEVYYDGDFISKDSEEIFKAYVDRVFYQFHSTERTVKPRKLFAMEGRG